MTDAIELIRGSGLAVFMLVLTVFMFHKRWLIPKVTHEKMVGELQEILDHQRRMKAVTVSKVIGPPTVRMAGTVHTSAPLRPPKATAKPVAIEPTSPLDFDTVPSQGLVRGGVSAMIVEWASTDGHKRMSAFLKGRQIPPKGPPRIIGGDQRGVLYGPESTTWVEPTIPICTHGPGECIEVTKFGDPYPSCIPGPKPLKRAEPDLFWCRLCKKVCGNQEHRFAKSCEICYMRYRIEQNCAVTPKHRPNYRMSNPVKM